MANNRISKEIADSLLSDILGKYLALRTSMAFLDGLQDPGRLMTIGKERAGIDAAFMPFMTNHPTLLPSYVSTTETAKDVAFRDRIKSIRNVHDEIGALLQLAESLSEADCMDTYLAVYSSARDADYRGVAGIHDQVADMSKFFQTGRRPAAKAKAPSA